MTTLETMLAEIEGRDGFRKEWEVQQGALMFKSYHTELEWKKTIAEHFWNEAIKDRTRLIQAIRVLSEGLEFIDTYFENCLKRGLHQPIKVPKDSLTKATEILRGED